MADFLERRPEVGIMGPLVRFPDGRLQLSARAFPSIGQAVGHALLGFWQPDNRWTRAYRLTDWDHASERAVDWVSGCCIAVRRTAFDDVDGFDPRLLHVRRGRRPLRPRRRPPGGRSSSRRPPRSSTRSAGRSRAGGFRMVVEHARSLDRFFGRRYATGWRRLLRVPIRLGLLGWVGVAMAWSLVRRQTHAHA